MIFMGTVLVAGAGGFIGSNLCERLLNEGNNVIAIDNFSSGSKKNIDFLSKFGNFSFLEHDVVEPIGISEKVSQVYNCASPASPIDFAKIPIEILLTNSLGVKNLLDFCLEKKARFLQTSTSEVYGDPLVHPQKESYFGNVNPIGERACYDESKRFAEALIMAYRRKHLLEVRIARIFNTYGPRMRKDDGRVVPAFIEQALHNQPLTVFGEGLQTRSLISLCNSKSSIVKKPLIHADDPKKRKPDISLAKEKLKWEPKIPWQEGMKKTIGWFREN